MIMLSHDSSTRPEEWQVEPPQRHERSDLHLESTSNLHLSSALQQTCVGLFDSRSSASPPPSKQGFLKMAWQETQPVPASRYRVHLPPTSSMLQWKAHDCPTTRLSHTLPSLPRLRKEVLYSLSAEGNRDKTRTHLSEAPKYKPGTAASTNVAAPPAPEPDRLFGLENSPSG